MGISRTNLSLLKYIQEKGNVSLDRCARHFHKNTVTIRREIDAINKFIHTEIIRIEKGHCYCNLKYSDYLHVVQSITPYDYISNVNERLRVVLVVIFFKGYANTSDLYTMWNMSLTTKKKDMIVLRKCLQKRNLHLEIIRKKGLTIHGDELLFRTLIIESIYPLIEIDQDNQIYERHANTPLEHQIYTQAMPSLLPYISDCLNTINEYFSKSNILITYSSKKFLLLFLCCLYFKPLNKENITLNELLLSCKPVNLSDNSFLNKILGIICNMLDITPHASFEFHEGLWDHSEAFVKSIESCLTAKIFTHDLLVEEVYCYLHKKLILAYFDCLLADKLVRDVEKELPILYEIIQKCSLHSDLPYNILLDKDVLYTLTLLIQKHILMNNIYNSDKTRVVIVTNIPFERIEFYQQQLKQYFDIQIVAILNLNILYQMDNLKYDIVLTFSDRTYNIVKKKEKNTLRTNFFISSKDIEMLSLYGIQKAKTKLLAEQVINELSNFDTLENKVQYLLNKYPDIFISEIN